MDSQRITLSIQDIRNKITREFKNAKFANRKATAVFEYLSLIGVCTRINKTTIETYKSVDDRISALCSKFEIGDIVYLIGDGTYLIIATRGDQFVGVRIKLVEHSDGSDSFAIDEPILNRTIRDFTIADAFRIRRGRFNVCQIQALYADYKVAVSKLKQIKRAFTDISESEE